jgi:hypothetical protein
MTEICWGSSGGSSNIPIGGAIAALRKTPRFDISLREFLDDGSLGISATPANFVLVGLKPNLMRMKESWKII